MKREPLSTVEIALALESLPKWRFEDDQLHRSITFQGFREAVAFIVRLAFEAEARDHHPFIVNVYGSVDISLTTHEAGNRVTAMDIELANAIERILTR